MHTILYRRQNGQPATQQQCQYTEGRVISSTW